MRYERLLAAVREKQPKCIVEIGTWNGARALEMLNLAPDAVYYGFDLFESANEDTDRDEMNVKPHYYLDRVYERLDGFHAYLFKGNTRETLPHFRPERPVDFVWLDGGHSVETIRSDWENLKPHLADDAVVFFDDFYEGPIDTERFGCNAIVAELDHEVLPDSDPVAGGGVVRMVRVYPKARKSSS
jgi:predicted O-methyltransferase YrrM